MNTNLESTNSYLRSYRGPEPPSVSSRIRPTITITRDAGAGGVTVARLLAEKLEKRLPDANVPWAVFEDNIVHQVLQEHGLPQRLEMFMQEDAIPTITDVIEDVLGLHPPSAELAEHTAETLFRLAVRGHAILVGRGAHIVSAPLKHAFHVKLTAPLPERITRVERYYNIGYQEARTFVARVDRARRRYLRKHFKTPLDNPLAFHLTINTGSVSCEEAADLITEIVVRRTHAHHHHAAAGETAATHTPKPQPSLS